MKRWQVEFVVDDKQCKQIFSKKKWAQEFYDYAKRNAVFRNVKPVSEVHNETDK